MTPRVDTDATVQSLMGCAHCGLGYTLDELRAHLRAGRTIYLCLRCAERMEKDDDGDL